MRDRNFCSKVSVKRSDVRSSKILIPHLKDNVTSWKKYSKVCNNVGKSWQLTNHLSKVLHVRALVRHAAATEYDEGFRKRAFWGCRAKWDLIKYRLLLLGYLDSKGRNSAPKVDKWSVRRKSPRRTRRECN